MKNNNCNNSEYCSDNSCEKSTQSHNGHGSFFLELADCAWTEVLKEKIKEHIKQQDGEWLTNLARIIAEANKKRWENKMCKEHGCQEFEEQLCSFFSKKEAKK